ncbi:MAG: hypothetical protein IKN71_02035, partial [Alphaproteobacteria bacterium]|nr:hypothetical protein [Alphaproteobacteria bacterium]
TEEPVCFKAVWGDKKGRYEQGEIKDGVWAEDSNGTKYYKEVPENPCTSKDPDIKLDPRGYNDIHPGEPGYPANGADTVYQFYYTKWAPDENCSCKLEECPWPTRSKEEARQDWGDCIILIQITTKEKHGFDCYTYDVSNAIYGVTEEKKVEGKCYDDGVIGDFGVKCYREVECGCPEGTSSAKPNDCYDKYADEFGMRAKEVTLENGTVCYPTDEPKCDIGEYDYTNCKCAISSCSDEKALEYDGIPEGCRECHFTGDVTSKGKQCWICDQPEAGFSETATEDCSVSQDFKKFDENGSAVATTTCFKEGEEEVTDAECLIKDIRPGGDGTTVTFVYNTYIRATTLCEAEGSTPKTEDVKLGGPYSIAVSQLDPCKDGKISFTERGEYKGKSYICQVDQEVAPNCELCDDECPGDEKPATELDDLTGWKATNNKACNGTTDITPSIQCYAPDDEPCKDLTPENEIEGCVDCVYKSTCAGVKYYECKPMDGYEEKTSSEVTTTGWDCKPVVIDGKTITANCCKAKECPNKDMIPATSTFDLTPYVDSDNNCVSYKSTNPKTYSGEDECLQKDTFNICPNSSDADAYESEAEAKAACGTEVIAIGDIDIGCGDKSYTCYKCADLPTYCRNLNENYVAETECTAGCQSDRKTLRTCKPVEGTKCVQIVDEECADNQKCDGSQDKCVDDLPPECDTTFDGWTFEGEYVINTTACSPNTCENCVETGQTIQDGSKCYAHTKNPEDGWTVGAGTGELCAITKNFTAGTMSFPCYKLDQIDDTPLCFIEDVVPEVSKITASTKEIKYKRNVRMLHICHSDGKQKLGDEILQSEPNTLNFPGFNDTTCENGKLVRLAANDSTHYNGQLLECKLATNIQINCPKRTPEEECPKRGEYATEAACKADLGSGCNGNKPVTCTENTVDDITCYKKTEGEECTGSCVDGQCSTCENGTASDGQCCPSHLYGTKAACEKVNGTCNQVSNGGNYPEGCWFKYVKPSTANCDDCKETAYVYCYLTETTAENGGTGYFTCMYHVPCGFSKVEVLEANGTVGHQFGAGDHSQIVNNMRLGAYGNNCRFYRSTSVAGTATWEGNSRPAGYPSTSYDWYCEFTYDKCETKKLTCPSDYPYKVSFASPGADLENATNVQECEDPSNVMCGWKFEYHSTDPVDGKKCAKLVKKDCPADSCTATDGKQPDKNRGIDGYSGDDACYNDPQVCNDDGSSKEHEECICVCPNGYWYSIENSSRDGIYPGSDGYNPNGDYGDYSGDCEEFGYNGQWCSCPSRPYRNTDPKMERRP